jgi:hypothetical protein
MRILGIILVNPGHALGEIPMGEKPSGDPWKNPGKKAYEGTCSLGLWSRILWSPIA